MRKSQHNQFVAFIMLVLAYLVPHRAHANPMPSLETVHQIYTDLFVDLTEAELEARILTVTNLFEPKFTSEVKGFLRVYLSSRPSWSQTLLGRTNIFFPIFERKIEDKGLPNDVKFISIIESALRTEARSRVGAQGLWQFMPGTAKDNDLVIDKYIDEREDPYRATDAALEYLSELHHRYNDWALAIAAYNSGPGRVNQAMAITGAKNFWAIRDYLPRETRNYVPSFLAAAYLMKYYSEHYLTPDVPRLDFQLTRAFKVYDEMSFDKISKITGLSKEDITFLNTSYRKDFIPNNKVGYTLLLPLRVAPLMDAYLNKLEKPAKSEHQPQIILDSTAMDGTYYDHVVYEAQPGEKLNEIAELFNVDKYNIRHWNNMSSDDLSANKSLLIHYLRNENKILVNNNNGSIRKFAKRNKVNAAKMQNHIFNIASVELKKLPAFVTKSWVMSTNPYENLDTEDHYRLRRGESLQDALRKNPSLEPEEAKSQMMPTQLNGIGIVIPVIKKS